MVDLRCTLNIRVGGKVVRGSQSKYLNGLIAEMKGLTETFAQKYPNVEHRYCIRHMYSNFNKLYKGKEWKDLMWGAASVYTVQEFEERMNEIKEIDKTAYEWLMREEPTTWARCMYSTMSKCNRMDNNTSEAFNTAIKDARDQPILSMVEIIRRYLMTRLQTRLKLCMGWNGNICPRISRRIERTQQLMGESEVMYSGGTIFEVICVPRIYVVDIGQKTCTCRKWDVSGIPCAHGMAAIITDKSDPEDYVDQCFHQNTFARTYSFTIKPIPDQTMWVRTDFDPISPPLLRPKSGRPKKNRRKGPDEPKTTSSGVRKYYTTLKCGQCKQPGHNARTCPHKLTNSIGEQGVMVVVGGRGRGIQNEGGRGGGVIGGRGRGIENEGGRGRGLIGGRGRGVTGGRGRGVPTASRGIGGVNNGSRGRGNGRGRAIGPNSGANTGANNGLVVKGRGPNQGILIGRERAANSQMVNGRGRGANNGNGSRGGGRGRGGTNAALPGVVIKERNPNIGVDLGTNKGAKTGKGKEPIVGKVKIPTTRFGGAESIAQRVGLPIPQGSRRSTRIGNAFFWNQTASSSAASCGSGSGSGSATMPNTHIPSLDSQGATSTPSTHRSAT